LFGQREKNPGTDFTNKTARCGLPSDFFECIPAQRIPRSSGLAIRSWLSQSSLDPVHSGMHQRLINCVK
jgi:hypothetical protein